MPENCAAFWQVINLRPAENKAAIKRMRRRD